MSRQPLLNLSLIFSLCACAPIAISPTSSQPTASPSASISPSPTATSTPIAQATSDIWINRASSKGQIFDEQQRPLNDALVKVISLNSSIPYETQTLSVNGEYTFNNAPPGVQLAISASKAGYITQTREVVLKANHEGNPIDPLFNRFDFSLSLDPASSPQP